MGFLHVCGGSSVLSFTGRGTERGEMFTLHKTQGGVHPPQCKDTRDVACVNVAPPERVRIPLNMHIGGPCKPVVAAGDHVYVGTLIGDGQGLYAPIHASMSGTVVSADTEKLPSGQTACVVEIESDGKMEPDPGLEVPSYEDTAGYLDCVRASGMVGLGGASFPTWFKMRAPKGKDFEFLIINAMECEPFITSDFRLMMETPELVVEGVHRCITALGIPAAVIGVEDNKPEAVEKLKAVIADKGWGESIEVLMVPTKYPQGGEKVLIHSTTGRDVPAGGLPSDCGCLVVNATTIAKLETFFKTGMPLVSKTLTIAGDCVANPGNYVLPIGMSVADAIEAAGGLSREPRKVILGGPMMGRTTSTLETPLLKANNAILCLYEKGELPEETPCIRCGRCVRACPLGLLPYAIDSASRRHDAVALDELAVMNCMSCGSCAYVCPAHRRITASIAEGKAVYRGECSRLVPKEAK